MNHTKCLFRADLQSAMPFQGRVQAISKSITKNVNKFGIPEFTNPIIHLPFYVLLISILMTIINY